MTLWTDATGFQFHFTAPPQRIVCLVPSWTELLLEWALPVVGRTRYCIHPAAEVAQIPVVGGTKDFKPEAIRDLQPDLVIANREENVPEPLLALRQEIPVYTTVVGNLAEAQTTLQELGRLCARETAATALISELAKGFADLPQPPNPIRTLYLIWRKPYMSIGGDTFIHDLLAIGNFANVCQTQGRYPSLTPADIQALNPELVLLSSEPFPFQTKHISELQALCPQARIELVDGAAFSWYGSRLRTTPAEIRRIHNQITPFS
jgi:ABC-type Fe3+-hydroxamate transport system substrate-binding protein